MALPCMCWGQLEEWEHGLDPNIAHFAILKCFSRVDVEVHAADNHIPPQNTGETPSPFA